MLTESEGFIVFVSSFGIIFHTVNFPQNIVRNDVIPVLLERVKSIVKWDMFRPSNIRP